MTGLNWRVRCEHAHRTDISDIVGRFVGREVSGSNSKAVQQIERQKRRVALVQVISVNLESERPQNSDAADAEDDFLFEPVGVVAAIQVMGEGAVFFGILIEVRVEE